MQVNQLHAEQLRHDPRAVADSVEQALHRMAEATGAEAGYSGATQGGRLRDRAGDIGLCGGAQLRRAGRTSRAHAHHHPRQLIGGLASPSLRWRC